MLESSASEASESKRTAKSKDSSSSVTDSSKVEDSDFRVAEIYLERQSSRSIVGNIYRGTVANVLPGLEAAFIDIGLEKNGFLHVDEIVMPGVQTPKRGQSSRSQKGITELLKPGQEVTVQVVKDPLKTKGPRLSMNLTIAGRYMVYSPTGEGIGISRRLDDRERTRLRRELNHLTVRSGGAIVRTAAQGATYQDFERELIYLYKLNEILEQRVADQPSPSLVFQEADLAIRVLRDISTDELDRAVLDDVDQYERLKSFFSRTAPDLVERVDLYQEDVHLFERYGVDEAIEGTMKRRVDLASGGYLVFDYAEALTVVDINTGSFTGKGRGARLEDTILQTNLEAAKEVVRQLRLRDIGGIIVIDFIDMAKASNRDAVLRELRKALDYDRTKTYVVEVSPLGLVEMTRQNVTEGVRELMTKMCPICHGEGVVRSEQTVAIDVRRKLTEIAAERPKVEAFLVQVNSRVRSRYMVDGCKLLRSLEKDTGKVFFFEGSDGLPSDFCKVVYEGNLDEVQSRSLPFEKGNEVLVEIVEPHMFQENDAVAKIDGYIVTVANAGEHIGTKKLVKITDTDRFEASAELVEVSDTKSESDSVKSTAGDK